MWSIPKEYSTATTSRVNLCKKSKMSQGNISNVLKTTKEANLILGKAGSVIIKSSFNTAKQLASLYKEAGFKAFKLSRDVVKKTVELTLDNQKSALKTSGTAIKEAAKSIRENAPELETMTKAKAKKIRRTPARKA